MDHKLLLVNHIKVTENWQLVSLLRRVSVLIAASTADLISVKVSKIKVLSKYINFFPILRLLLLAFAASYNL